MPQKPSGRARFGPFELDLRAGELHRNGQTLLLREQLFQVLLMLIEHQGEIATREAIKRRLWPNDTIVEFDKSINAAIMKLRHALGDSAEEPQYIQTIARRGYRLMVAVEWIGRDAAPDLPHEGDTKPADAISTPVKAESGIGVFTGKTVSHYRVLDVIGGGGMGLVYRAEDLRLGRAVALKFLPEDLGTDPTALERFEREARAVSALSHPNICSIYEFDEYEGQPFIVMELLRGQTLREHIAAGHFRLPHPAGLDIAIQIAAGLEAAHEKGIIHRDIKPANIFITEKVVAKILDFGVAKVLQLSEAAEAAAAAGKRGAVVEVPDRDKGHDFSRSVETSDLDGRRNQSQARLIPALKSISPDGTHVDAPLQKHIALTRTGMKLGTAGYMSPEQVRGEPVDARTDIFSFGLVLYEMATGERAFTGETETLMQAAILNGKPRPACKSNPEVTPEMEALIDKCLVKSPDGRFQNVGDIRAALTAIRPTSHGEGWSIARRTLAVLVAVLLVIASAVAIWWRRRPLAEYAFDKYTMSPLTETGNVSLADMSPDGKYLAYTDDESGKQSLWLEQMATASTGRLLGPVSGLLPGLRFTPDGNYIYFSQSDPKNGRNLFRIPISGGTAEKLRPEVFHDVFYQIAFSPDGKQLVFARRTRTGNSLVIANADGTNERTLLTFAPAEVVAMPAWSPSGNQIAFLMDEKRVGAFTCLAVVSVNGGRERRILRDAFSMFGVAWLADNSGLAVTTAPQRSQPAIWILSYPNGTLRRVTSDLAEYFGVSTALAGRRIVSVQKLMDSALWVAPADNPSQAVHLREGSGRKDGMMGVAWLADGKIVYASEEGEVRNELWTVSRDGRDRRRLSTGPDADMHPSAASATGKIVFSRVDSVSNMWDIWETNGDGTGTKRLTSSPATKLGPEISPDATWITYATTDGPYKMSVATGRINKLAPSGEYPAISADGKWIAFVTSDDQTKKDVVEIIPSDAGAPPRFLPFIQEPQVPVTANLGSAPIHWTADGKAITYVRTKDGASNIWAQPVAGGPARQLTNFTSMYIWRHAWSPDGKYLVMARGNFSRDAAMLTDTR